MKVVYVAGPYRADSEWEIEQNFRRAERVALQVWLAGCACICPHKNTARFGGAAPDDLWLEGDLEMVRRCDAIVCVDGWERSIGAQGEVRLARSLGIAVFETIDDFLAEEQR
ncbi:MAG: DUF1937 family protein [Lacipirellulaceae bacterium]